MSKSIVLVDDEALVRMALKFNLQGEGFEVDEANSGETGFAMLAKRPYDLLLTDYLMEGMSGAELIRKMKKLYPNTKIMVFSGYEHGDLADRMKELGVDNFFGKPIDFDDLTAKIAQVLCS